MSENIEEQDLDKDIVVQVEEQTQEPKKTGKKDFFIGFFSAIGSIILSFIPFVFWGFPVALVAFIVLSIIKKKPFLIIGFVSGCGAMVLLAFGLCFGIVLNDDFIH